MIDFTVFLSSLFQNLAYCLECNGIVGKKILETILRYCVTKAVCKYSNPGV